MADDERARDEPITSEIERVGNVDVEDVDGEQGFDPAVLIPVSQLAEFLQNAALRIQPRKSKRYPRPFFIDELLINKLDRRVRNSMADLAASAVSIAIEVRYTDRSSETYRDIQECFDSAGDDTDAESIELVWSGLSVAGNFVGIEISCVTEKPLDDSGSRAPVPEAAGIVISVSGDSRRWVRSTFAQLESLINATRLSMLFRPLEAFRHAIFSAVGSWILGAMAWYVSFKFLTDHVERAENQSRIQNILDRHSLNEQFAAFIRDALSPHGSFLIGLLLFMIPYGLLFLGHILGGRYLPYLVPRSSVSIGLSSRRYLDYINVFKFIIFTVVVGSTLGVIVNLLSGLL